MGKTGGIAVIQIPREMPLKRDPQALQGILPSLADVPVTDGPRGVLTAEGDLEGITVRPEYMPGDKLPGYIVFTRERQERIEALQALALRDANMVQCGCQELDPHNAEACDRLIPLSDLHLCRPCETGVHAHHPGASGRYSC
jgi:hypothetical protein